MNSVARWALIAGASSAGLAGVEYACNAHEGRLARACSRTAAWTSNAALLAWAVLVVALALLGATGR